MIKLLFSLAFAFSGTVLVSPKTAMVQVAANRAIILDVREPEELAEGKIKDAHVFPSKKVGTPAWDHFVQSLPKNKEIYTYCRSGRRSDKVAEQLRAKGFKASNTGGYKDWLDAGASSTNN